MKTKDLIIQQRDYLYNEMVEFVEEEEIEWDDIYLESDYNPPFEDYSEYINFSFIKGGYIALDNLLNNLTD